MMNALVVEISFFEAFFKVHYTKGFRLTYPIPLPTSVAGIFGAFLGVERERLREEFNGMLFGAKLLRYSGIASENATFLQYKAKGVERGVTQISIVNEPTYLIAMAGEGKKLEKAMKKIRNSVSFLSYGGQNDFFVKDWEIVGIEDVEESNIISNYAPQDLVENPILEEGSEIQILPVMHRISKNPNFYFVMNGKLKLKQNIYCVKEKRIGLYSLKDFS